MVFSTSPTVTPFLTVSSLSLEATWSQYTTHDVSRKIIIMLHYHEQASEKQCDTYPLLVTQSLLPILAIVPAIILYTVKHHLMCRCMCICTHHAVVRLPITIPLAGTSKHLLRMEPVFSPRRTRTYNYVKNFGNHSYSVTVQLKITRFVSLVVFGR